MRANLVIACVALAARPVAADGRAPRRDVDPRERASESDAEAGTASDSPDRAGELGGEDDREPGSLSVRLVAPPIGEVLGAAYQAANLDRDPSRGWNRRARLSGLVPWVSVRVGRDTSWNDLEPEIDHDTTVEVRATWRLDRLLFEGRELQVASIDTARRRERRRLASRVIRAYFTWRRLAEAAVRQPGLALRVEEARAELDALTDGWFGDELDRKPKP